MFPLFDLCWWTDGRTKPFIELRVRNKKNVQRVLKPRPFLLPIRNTIRFALFFLQDGGEDNQCSGKNWGLSLPYPGQPSNHLTPILGTTDQQVACRAECQVSRVASKLFFTFPQRCRLSVMCQLYAHVRKHFILPGRVFVPPPDVDVAVVTLHPKLVNDIPEVEFKMVEKLVRNVFQFRQKEVKG